MENEIETPTMQLQIENLYSIIRKQQVQINNLHAAYVGHQNIFEALLPAAVAAKPTPTKVSRCASQSN